MDDNDDEPPPDIAFPDAVYDRPSEQLVEHSGGLVSVFVEPSSPRLTIDAPSCAIDPAPSSTGVGGGGTDSAGERRRPSAEVALVVEQHKAEVLAGLRSGTPELGSPGGAGAQLDGGVGEACKSSPASHLRLATATMKHRHSLSTDVLGKARDLSRPSSASVSPMDEGAPVRDLQAAVPNPQYLRVSPGTAPLTGVAGVSQDALATLVASFSAYPLQDVAPPPTLGVQRSDVDDSWLMQQLLRRQKTNEELAARERNEELVVAVGSDEEDDDPNNANGVVPSPSGGSAAEGSPRSPRAPRVRRVITSWRDDFFLESLNLTVLDDTIDWSNPAVFNRSWWKHTYLSSRVERDFTRYEAHHHQFKPQLIFAVVVLAIVLAICVCMWVIAPASTVSAIWSALLGASVTVVVSTLAAMKFASELSQPLLTDDAATISSTNSVKKTRKHELWSARLGELSAFVLLLVCVWASLSAYASVSELCYRREIFYVPWIQKCEPVENVAGSLLGDAVHTTADGLWCPDINVYCERALYPFVVPSVMTCVVLFRPRAMFAVPAILSTPFAFAASRYLTASMQTIDPTPVYWSKVILIVAIALFACGVKIALEREQRRRFQAYALLYGQLSLFVKRREALADFLDVKIPPLFRTRLLSGNLSVDHSHQATCALFDIAEFPTWCTKTLPLQAATSVMQLHDVLSARCLALGVERIRSLGDVFVAVSNLSVTAPNHAALCCQLALQIFSDAYQFRKAFASPIALRCGAHSGMLIGIVLGKTYRRYDVLGDALATAFVVLDAAHGHQILVTESLAKLAENFVITTDRASATSGNSRTSSSSGSVKSTGSGGTAGGSLGVNEVQSPFTRATHVLRLVQSLRAMVPPCEAYVKMSKEGVNHRESARRSNHVWARRFSRAIDDQRTDSDDSGDNTNDSGAGGSSSSAVLAGRSSSRQGSYSLLTPAEAPAVAAPANPERATFEVVEITDEKNRRSVGLHESRAAQQQRRGLLNDPQSLRDFVVQNNTSTELLTKAIAETRQKRVCGPFLKRFASEAHELEFSMNYIRVADRTPFVVTLVALAVVYTFILGVTIVEHRTFPPMLLNSTNLDRLNDRLPAGSGLMSSAIALSIGLALIVWNSPNMITNTPVLMWIATCTQHAMAVFAVVTSSPSVAGSDATYLYFLSLISLHFGSWSVSGLMIITAVDLAVFLAATNTSSGTYLPIWILPLLVIVAVLNTYFDRNRERRLRELYRDLFLTKAASEAVEGEERVRRSILRATIPRPLFELAADSNNKGKLLTTSVNDAVVVQLRLDGLRRDVAKAFTHHYEQRLRQNRNGRSEAALADQPHATREEREDDALLLLRESGRAADATVEDDHTVSDVVCAIAAAHRATDIIEGLLDCLTGTELAMVHVFGDLITIAGPLEEKDSRLYNDDGSDAANVRSSAAPTTQAAPREERKRNRQQLELRIQRAAYDSLMLIALLHQYNWSANAQGNPRPAQGTSVSDPSGVGTPLGTSPQAAVQFSAACTSDTVINVLANGEYPTYDLLGSAAYASRVLLQQLPESSCVVTEQFIEFYNEELSSSAEAAASPRAVMPDASPSREGQSSPTAAAARGRRTSAPHLLPPLPRIGDKERWRVRGLGTLWIHHVFPGERQQTSN